MSKTGRSIERFQRDLSNGASIGVMSIVVVKEIEFENLSSGCAISKGVAILRPLPLRRVHVPARRLKEVSRWQRGVKSGRKGYQEIRAGFSCIK